MQCLDNTLCVNTEAVKYMVPIELLPTSHCPGAIEAACKLMHDQVAHQLGHDMNDLIELLCSCKHNRVL